MIDKLKTLAMLAVVGALLTIAAHAANTEVLTLIATGPPFGYCASNGAAGATLFPYWSSSPGEPWQGNVTTPSFPVVVPPPPAQGAASCFGNTEIIERVMGSHCPCMFSVTTEQNITVLVASPHTVESLQYATEGNGGHQCT